MMQKALEQQRIKQILIIRTDNIGDVILTTPLIHRLHEHIPNALIDVYLSEYTVEVLNETPFIRRIYRYTKLKHQKGVFKKMCALWRRLKTGWQLRRNRYDLIIIAQTNSLKKYQRLSRLLSPGKLLYFNELSSDRNAPVQKTHQAVKLHYFLEQLGIPTTMPAVKIFANPSAIEHAKTMLTSQSWYQPRITLALHISARKVQQRWPEHSFIHLIRALHEKFDYQFILFWSPGDANNSLHPGDDTKAQTILRATKDLPILGYPTHTLTALMGGISMCDAMICSDGGAMHIAAGLGKPIVCFFGNSDPDMWHPWGVPYELLQPPSRDVRDITPEQAIYAVEKLLASHPKLL